MDQDATGDEAHPPADGNAWPVETSDGTYWAAVSALGGLLKGLFLSREEAWKAASALDTHLLKAEAALKVGDWSAAIVEDHDGNKFIALWNEDTQEVSPGLYPYDPLDPQLHERLEEILTALDASPGSGPGV